MTSGVTVARPATELDHAFSSERAFREWYDGALPRVYGFVLGHLAGDRDLAEEITQQTFIDAVRDHDRFDGRSEVVTWLCAIARHKIADHFRRLERQEHRHQQLIVRQLDVADASAEWRSAEDRDEIEAALRTLPAFQRATLVFFHLDGLTVREIATLMGRSEHAVESALRRARTAFRHAIGEPDDG